MDPTINAGVQVGPSDNRAIIAKQAYWINTILQRLDPQRPILVSCYQDLKGKWTPFFGDGRVQARRILLNELVLELDVDDWAVQVEEGNKLKKYLDLKKIPYLLGFSGNKGLHFHIFLDENRLKKIVGEWSNESSIDKYRTIRKTLADIILKNSGMDYKKAKVDRSRIDWSASSRGSLIREFGAIRANGNYKTILVEIPERKPSPGELPILIPSDCKTWDLKGIEHKLTEELEREGRKASKWVSEAVKVSGPIEDVPCFQAMLRGLPEGKRHNGGFYLTHLMAINGKTKEEASKVLRQYSRACGGDSDFEKEVENTVCSIFKNGEPNLIHKAPLCYRIREELGEEVCDRPRCIYFRKVGIVDQVSKIIEQAINSGAIFFHDERNEPHVNIPLTKGGRTNLAIDDRGFADWLAFHFYRSEGKAPSGSVLNDAMLTLRGKARFEGEQRALSVRDAEYEGAFFYDLCNQSGSSVKITPEGWQIVEPPIIFRKFEHMKPQVEPVIGQHGTLDRFVNMWKLASDDDIKMLKVVLGSYMVPGIIRPVIGLHGPQGSTKSTLARAIKTIVDPSEIETPPLPSKEDELLRMLSRHYLNIFDNVRDMREWQSDLLCVAVTGGSTAKRALYRNDDDFIRKIKTGIILSGVNLEITEPDLLDRSLPIELARIPDNERREEAEVVTEVRGMIPALLGELFDYVSQAMKIKQGRVINRHPRMADWYSWAICLAEVMGIPETEFNRIFNTFIERQSTFAIENALLATTILDVVQGLGEGKQYLVGTSARVLELLATHAEQTHTNIKNSKVWPKDPPRFGKDLNKIRENLTQNGIHVLDCYYREIKNEIRCKNIEVIGGNEVKYRDMDRIKIITRDIKPFEFLINPPKKENSKQTVIGEPDSTVSPSQQKEKYSNTVKQ